MSQGFALRIGFTVGAVGAGSRRSCPDRNWTGKAFCVHEERRWNVFRHAASGLIFLSSVLHLFFPFGSVFDRRLSSSLSPSFRHHLSLLLLSAESLVLLRLSGGLFVLSNRSSAPFRLSFSQRISFLYQ